jgi:hypothetical protein
MVEDLNSPGINKPSVDGEAIRKRLAWQFALVNVATIILMPVLSLQRGFTTQITIILTAGVLLVVNGALWLGLRIRRVGQRTNRGIKPRLFFVIGAFAALVAVVEITSNDYGSAALLLLGCVSMIWLGLIARRNKAKTDAGQTQRR